ncbi:hypothetical protein I0P70_19870 [Pontibacter sp. FD36]|uniref:hypothetical protein n=1 Tax=Pontibacter sp. FD36 TaxID=2789860 RepID=UPI0018A93F95|nr:hypothetical protein [Pontibacter sp. FD36]MBF8965518.1 hypothetical protein [Pontibacter sp. FD36]
MKTKQTEQKQEQATATVAKVAAGIGIGLIAGLVGTVVMTAAQMLEMQFSGRKPSDTPYQAVKKTFGIETKTEEDKELVSNITHFAYGSTWGVPRGLMAAFGAKGAVGTTAHFGAVWGAEIVMLPMMDISEPIYTWKPNVIAEDAMYHGVYVLATGITADALANWLQKAYE